MKISLTRIGVFLFLGLSGFSNSPANSPAAPTWSIIWFPWSDTFRSWDWKEAPRQVAIWAPTIAPFPSGIKVWDLAVCSAAEPAKKVLVPMATPPRGDGIYLDKWTPGDFPTAQLDNLGDGTFLCAILGGGHRFSNVSLVTIDHSYHPDLHPIIKLAGVASPEGDIRHIAVWVVPSRNPPQSIWDFDLWYPYISIDGKWSGPGLIAWSGQNRFIPPGTGWGEIVSLEGRMPPVTPFKKAAVQVRIIENFIEHVDLFSPNPKEEDVNEVMKRRSERLKGYTSGVFNLSVNDRDQELFDHAFGLK
jgi:hypothetical protein